MIVFVLLSSEKTLVYLNAFTSGMNTFEAKRNFLITIMLGNIAQKYLLEYVGAFSTYISASLSSTLLVFPLRKIKKKYHQEGHLLLPLCFLKPYSLYEALSPQRLFFFFNYFRRKAYDF